MPKTSPNDPGSKIKNRWKNYYFDKNLFFNWKFDFSIKKTFKKKKMKKPGKIAKSAENANLPRIPIKSVEGHTA